MSSIMVVTILLLALNISMESEWILKSWVVKQKKLPFENACSQHKKQKFEKDLRQTGSTSKKIYLHGHKNGYTWPYAEKYTYNVIWLKL